MSIAAYIAENFPLTGTAAMVADYVAYEVSQRNAKPIQVVKDELKARIEKKRAQKKRTAEERAELRAITFAQIEASLKGKRRAA